MLQQLTKFLNITQILFMMILLSASPDNFNSLDKQIRERLMKKPQALHQVLVLIKWKCANSEENIRSLEGYELFEGTRRGLVTWVKTLNPKCFFAGRAKCESENLIMPAIIDELNRNI